MGGPLSGIRVLALETFLAGPFGSMSLADLGAEVIKIESSQGDGSRLSVGPNHNGESSHFLAYNRNKKSIILDLRTHLGKEAFYDLVKISDVVWNNFRAGAPERVGIDYETLSKINPRIICTNISGFGPTGPYHHRPSNDSVICGYSGILSVTGEPGGRPIRPGPAIPDLAGALYGVIGTIGALYEREQTSRGQNVDVSLLGAALAFMSYHIAYYTCSGIVPAPLGSGYGHAVPYGAYKTQDSYIVLGPCWPRIARVLGIDWLIDDPRFDTLASRLEHRQELDQEIEKGLMQMTTDEWLPILEANDILYAPLNTVDKTLDDPQVRHLGIIIDIEHALGGKIRLAGNPIIQRSMRREHVSPPIMGQHTDDVLKNLLGYSEEKIRKLKEEQEAHYVELAKHTRKQQ